MTTPTGISSSKLASPLRSWCAGASSREKWPTTCEAPSTTSCARWCDEPLPRPTARSWISRSPRKRLVPGQRRKELVPISDPKAEAIIEAVQPCHALDGAEAHPLWLLHLLNNWDKHRMVQVAVLNLGFPVDTAPSKSAGESHLAQRRAGCAQRPHNGLPLHREHATGRADEAPADARHKL